MRGNAYHFEDRWRVPFPPEKVWDALARPENYPLWCRGVYLSATPLDREGERVAVVARGGLQPDGNGTVVTLEWNPIVEKPLVKFLSPILKPLFRWNHEWTMKRGARQIMEYLSTAKWITSE